MVKERNVKYCVATAVFLLVPAFGSLSAQAVQTGSIVGWGGQVGVDISTCLLYTSPSPRDQRGSRMPSSA